MLQRYWTTNVTPGDSHADKIWGDNPGWGSDPTLFPSNEVDDCSIWMDLGRHIPEVPPGRRGE